MSIELVTGDCLAVMEKMAPETVDVVVTSPPYNLGVKYRSGFPDGMPRSQYLDWLSARLVGIKRVLAYKGSLFLNMGGKPSDPWPPFEVLTIARNVGFHLQNLIYWVKSLSEEEGEPVTGHVKPINSKKYLTDAVEHIFHLTKTGDVELDRLAIGVPFKHKGNLDRDGRGKNGDNRCPGNVWVIHYPTIQNRDKERPHPASFPPTLAERCFKLHGLSRIKMTMDPFSGLGSTARAARALGLNHIGIELSAEDVADAKKLLGAEPVPGVGVVPMSAPIGRVTFGAMPPAPEEPCKACGGSGKNSKGGPCGPCAKRAAGPKRPKLHEPEPPVIPGRFCAVCKLPVHRTKSGDLCINGHLDGPELGDEEPDEEAPPIPKGGKKRKPARVPTGGTQIGATTKTPETLVAPKKRPSIMDGFTK